MFIQEEHAGKEKIADMRHLGQPLWIHCRSGKTVNTEGLWQNAVKVQEKKSIAARIFPSQYTWQNYLQVAYLNLARSQLFQGPIEQKRSPVS